MDRPRWHSKLVYLAFAFTLVFSLLGVFAMPTPVAAAPDNFQSVTLSVSNTTPCCCDNFTVMATIETPTTEPAYNVSGSLSWLPSDLVALVSGPDKDNFTILENSSANITWVVHCEGPGLTTFLVDISATNYTTEHRERTIEQKSARLEANILDPLDDDDCGRSWLVCSTHNVTFSITNTGCSAAELVTAVIKPDATIEVMVEGVGKGAGVAWTTPTLGRIEAGESKNYTATFHCVEAGLDGMIDVWPNGRDVCTGKEIDANLRKSDLVEIDQYEPIVPECDADPNPTKVGHDTTFTASAVGGLGPPYWFYWDFGDASAEYPDPANPTASSSVTHAYAAAGNYTAVVTVSDGCNNVTCQVPVEVMPPLTVTCEVDRDFTKVCHNVTFGAEAHDGIPGATYTWSWDFGDSCGTSSEQNPSYHYNDSGNFTAVVTLTDNYDNEASCNVTVRVYDTLEVTCDIDPDNFTKVCHNSTLIANVTGGIPEAEGCNYTWEWDFGDGTSLSGTGYSAPSQSIQAIHHYATPGNYTATFNITDDCLDNIAACNVSVRVYPPLTVECEACPDETKVGHNVTFVGTASGGIPEAEGCNYSWTWYFGDGNSQGGTGYAPISATHSYSGVTEPTNFTVTLTLTDDCLDNVANCTTTVLVHPPLEVECDVTPDPQRVCNAVNFTATRSGGVPGHEYSWSWDFGDGNTSEEQNPTHTYMCVDNYTATVTLTDTELGNVANCSVTVEIIIEAPELYTPRENAQLTSKNVTFSWENIGCCDYTLEVWQKETDGQKVLEVEIPHELSSWTGPIFNGEWRWRVTAMDSCNNTAVSETWYFRVDQPGPAVEVMYPSDCGILLAPDSSVAITWTATPHDLPIDIEFSSDNGETWSTVASGEDNDGAYAWTTPDIESAQCLIRISGTDAASGYAEDTSNCAFTIGEPPTITVTNPNGGESYMPGGTDNITWIATDNVGVTAIDLYFSDDGGSTWSLIAEGLPNTGNYVWTIPGNVKSDLCLVKAVAFDAIGLSAEDTSDADFSIDGDYPQVTVNSPNGGEVLVADSDFPITWTATDLDGFGASQEDLIIDLYYSANSGTTWTAIATGETNDGVYPWKVPSVDSTGCLVKVVAADPAGNTGSDASDAAFTIVTDATDPTVTVTSPDGGESYQGGSAQTITWTATDDVAVTSVDLYLSSDGGQGWSVIALGETNDGTYDWTVPTINSEMCLVKAVAHDAAGNSAEDTSNAVFTIWTDPSAPSVTLTKPNGGELWRGDSQEFILWSATDDVSAQEDITIDLYYKVATGSWISIASCLVNDGEYKWTVDNISSCQVLVKVVATDEAGNSAFDTSDDEFCITYEEACPDSYAIALVEGWNLISLPLIPTNSSIEAVLAGVVGAGNVTSVWAYDAATATWLYYMPFGPATLTEMVDGPGYWINMNGPAVLTINGTCMPPPPDAPHAYNVYAGWNLMGIKSVSARMHSDYLGNIAGTYSVVWAYVDGQYVLVFPSPPGTGVMNPGSGFWIWVEVNGTIIPPGN